MSLGETRDFFGANLEDCRLCPRECGVNRRKGERGFCGAGAEIKVSSLTVHRGEEPPISGHAGSGTVFFTNCNMRCAYCQNYPISQLGHGNRITPGDLASGMLRLQARGAHNINLVTPTQHLPGVVLALTEARAKGLRLPVVYNTSGYESARTVRMLGDLVQIYLADMRYSEPEMGLRYSDAPDYPLHNRLAVRQMLEITGHLVCDRGIGVRGLIIRHLILPGGIAGTGATLEFIARELSPRVHVSLMCQYFPANRAHTLPELSRRITEAEYQEALDLLSRYGLENGWIQDLEADIPPVA